MKFKKAIYWAPRSIGILFVIFFFLSSLDVFTMTSGFLNILIALFMHNISTFTLLIFLIISWKYEIVGTVTFFILGIVYSFALIFTSVRNGFQWYYLAWAIEISGTAFVVGILFYLNKKLNIKSS